MAKLPGRHILLEMSPVAVWPSRGASSTNGTLGPSSGLRADSALRGAIGTAFALKQRYEASASQKQITQTQPMANPYRAETLRETGATNRFQIATLISDLSRTVALLTAEIEHEEKRAGAPHLADPAYSVLVSLRARRENIEATIASLEGVSSSLVSKRA